jgi:poly(hydroxyalkanoate) depolymerase family esterase
MVLHGCMQTHLVIQKDTDFNRISDAEGFIAVFPFITSYSGMRNQNCWGFWLAPEIKRGGGEVADLVGIVDEVAGSYSVDRDRVHMTGLSSGGAMTMVAAANYPDVFASVAPGAGVGYGETASCVTSSCSLGPTVITAASMASKTKAQMSTNFRRLPVMILHSTSDCTVQILNAQRILQSWGIVYNFNTNNPTSVVTGTVKGKSFKLSSYGDAEGTMLQSHFVDGLSHGWSGGIQNTYSFPDGPQWSQIAWDFFAANSMNGGNPEVKITAAKESNPQCISVAGILNDPSALASQVMVRLEGSVTVPAAVATLQGTNFQYDKCDLVNDNYYTPVAYTTDKNGKVNSDEFVGPAVQIGQPVNRPPQLQVNTPNVQSQCVDLMGTATGETHLKVYTRIDGGVVPGDWTLANWEASSGAFSASFCSLDAGAYAADALVMDLNGLNASASFTDFVIVAPNFDQSVTSTLTDHVASQRVATYSQCLGFGTCDTIYNDLYKKYGSTTTFTVYRKSETSVWYEEATNIPPPGPFGPRIVL